MAQKTFDESGNESTYSIWNKIQAMFTDLYNNGSVGAGSNSTITGLTGVTSINNSSLAIIGASETLSGLQTAGSLKVDTGTKTATAAAGAATLNKSSGIVTSEALTTAAGSDYTLTLTNSTIAAGDVPMVQIDSNGTAGLPMCYSAKCTANTLTVIVRNTHASAAFNAAIKIQYVILKA